MIHRVSYLLHNRIQNKDNNSFTEECDFLPLITCGCSTFSCTGALNVAPITAVKTTPNRIRGVIIKFENLKI